MRCTTWSTLLMVTAIFGVGCGSGAPDGDGQEITVFAASSLTEAFIDIGAAFETEHSGSSVTFNFAASSELVSQVIEGAPADAYVSADLANMTKLADADAVDGEPVVFATNRSEIIVEPGNPLGITGVDDLATNDLILVTCAPEVPCGAYAAQIFEQAGVEPDVDSFETNVKAVVTKVTLGEADAGIAYATDVIAAGDAADGVTIPDDINVVAEYPIAVTDGASNPELAQTFIEFVRGAEGQRILATFGFTGP